MAPYGAVRGCTGLYFRHAEQEQTATLTCSCPFVTFVSWYQHRSSAKVQVPRTVNARMPSRGGHTCSARTARREDRRADTHMLALQPCTTCQSNIEPAHPPAGAHRLVPQPPQLGPLDGLPQNEFGGKVKGGRAAVRQVAAGEARVSTQLSSHQPMTTGSYVTAQ